MYKYNYQSQIEKHPLVQWANTDKVGVITVSNVPALGKLTALRFIEWLQYNPTGLVSLPTGKTPEFFITWMGKFLSGWDQPDIQKELESWGIDPAKKPNMANYTFVQIDEFYPMNPAQENSFAFYIERFYFKLFGFDKTKALLMDTWSTGSPAGQTLEDIFGKNPVDLSLRYRQPVSKLEELQARAISSIDQYAMEFEERIKELGGIGFFLGGIGPDGHIGFNIRGSDHFSTTRLMPINYETAAAAAGDLGGIEIARQKLVVTIGLQTITQNPTTTAIIIAAGTNKAAVIRGAVEEEASILYPASVLHKLPAARFYLTQGAASSLTACSGGSPRGSALDGFLMEAVTSSSSLGASSQEKSYIEKINRGLEHYKDMTFLHTAPHHDDIMLGYLPFIVHLVRSASNTHYFATMTSGFNAISHNYALDQLNNFELHLKDIQKTIPKNSQTDVYDYLDGVANQCPEQQKRAEAHRMLRSLTYLAACSGENGATAQSYLGSLKEYFQRTYPGKKDREDVQILKGMIREWEEELLWGHLGFNENHIFHLRLGFYTGDIFSQQPEFERDVKPIINLLEKTNPHIVTVALDPEGSGPDTHYKVLQAVAQALMFYLKAHPEKKITVWGYRNVWFRFQPEQANIFVPVSLNSLAILKSAFHTCFGSQRTASFPSYEYDGPFCDLAQKIMVEQYTLLKQTLGDNFFREHQIPRLRATHGFCFLKAMTPEEFFKEADILRNQIENH